MSARAHTPRTMFMRSQVALSLTELSPLLHTVGSVEKVTQPMWVYNDDTEKLEKRDITYVPALFKVRTAPAPPPPSTAALRRSLLRALSARAPPPIAHVFSFAHGNGGRP